MRLDKNKAIKLRLQGRSYNEIKKILGVPKATLSDWFSGLDLPESAQERIKSRISEGSVKSLSRNKAQAEIAEKNAREIREAAKKEVKVLSKKELFLVGVSLYWAEGHKRPIVKDGKIKTSHPVSITNSDPNLVKLFLKFLKEVCKVEEEKIYLNVRMYRNQNEVYLLDFWNKSLNIPHSRIQKFYYKADHPDLEGYFSVLPFGTIQIRVNDTNLYHRIMGWIDGLSNIN